MEVKVWSSVEMDVDTLITERLDRRADDASYCRGDGKDGGCETDN